MAGALRNAARALAAGMRTQSGVQSRGMAKKTAFYSPNVPLENWASERCGSAKPLPAAATATSACRAEASGCLGTDRGRPEG